MLVFRKIWRGLFSWNTRFEIHTFALLPTYVWATQNGVFFLTNTKNQIFL